jgi:hypothetical protein
MTNKELTSTIEALVHSVISLEVRLSHLEQEILDLKRTSQKERAFYGDDLK